MMEDSQNKGEIVIYQPDEITRLEVRVEGETVWLNRHQLASLFGRDVKTIGKHIKNALREELADIPVVANFATTASDGKTYDVEYYNLDMVLSIGYRVKSSRGIQFRKWANSTLREYLMKGFFVVDDDVYHIGASLKDLGKKLFAFSKMCLSLDMLL